MEVSLHSQHVIMIIGTLLLVACIGFYSGKKVMGNSDFSHGGNKAGVSIVTGTIMGTLVGGASTIGTAQMAFVCGFSAWWFTLGAGIGCFFLGTFYAKPMRDSGTQTIPQLLFHVYGEQAGLFAGVFASLGMFLNIVAQVIALVALLSAMFHLSTYASAVLGIVLMACYVSFGGVWGTGMVGMVKVALLYFTVLLAGTFAYVFMGGITGAHQVFPSYPWFSLFGRGWEKDFSAGFSLVVGVLSTQTYFQAVLAGRDLKTSRRGCWLSTVLIPPIGMAGIFIGLFMKAHFPEINPAEVFPLFVIKFLNPWLGGVVLATLLISVIGTGAGLSLGIATILSHDIYQKYFKQQADERAILKLTRAFICLVLGLALLFVSGNLKSLILQWSFLSMGLRGATCFIPLTAALLTKGRVASWAGTWAIVTGPLVVIAWELFSPFQIDSLLIGILAALLIFVWGTVCRKINKDGQALESADRKDFSLKGRQ